MDNNHITTLKNDQGIQGQEETNKYERKLNTSLLTTIPITPLLTYGTLGAHANLHSGNLGLTKNLGVGILPIKMEMTLFNPQKVKRNLQKM
jgi:hypothetical protein